MTDGLNDDLSVPVAINTAAMDWEPSPSPTVWRKRLDRVGPPESGRVTSVVRYDPGSRFHAHPHPDGEEILVLEGIFSDQTGDYPAGSYLLNPEGFEHGPYSEEGCRLFVKLRQYPG
ncbi:MAG: cupin domain-containing protein [Rhodospirillales bacterium]|nr:cupin domain-containing protein [Rhodospirillales bacterium]